MRLLPVTHDLLMFIPAIALTLGACTATDKLAPAKATSTWRLVMDISSDGITDSYIIERGITLHECVGIMRADKGHYVGQAYVAFSCEKEA